MIQDAMGLWQFTMLHRLHPTCMHEKTTLVIPSGKWYQVQAAFERFETVISRSMEKSTQSPSANGHRPSTPQIPATRPQKVVVSTVIDKDIWAYMELVHGPELADIR